jgi:ubiquinone biosynthesis accessory factor UbiK
MTERSGHERSGSDKLVASIKEMIMLNAKIFEDLSGKVQDAVRNSPAKDIEKNMRALLAQGFSKLDLVTREEFDIQSQVLARTREQLAALEALVAELEATAHQSAQE